MKTTNKQKNFTMISDKLCRVPIKKISQTEKLYIAYILRYQANGNTLFASNKSIGEQLGIDGGSVKKLNNKMNKQFNFFSAIQDKKYENGTEYSSSHTIKVDEKLLDEFLDNVSTFTKQKASTENKPLETSISTQIIEEEQVEEIVSQIKDNEVISKPNQNRLSIDGLVKNLKYKYGSFVPDIKFDRFGTDIKEFGFNYVDELDEESAKYFNNQLDYLHDDGTYKNIIIFK
jgi:Mn-dependent DtxR family transcriptional regulator